MICLFCFTWFNLCCFTSFVTSFVALPQFFHQKCNHGEIVQNVLLFWFHFLTFVALPRNPVVLSHPDRVHRQEVEVLVGSAVTWVNCCFIYS